MAQLKTKQISDFTTAVQSLIDANDVLDQAQFDALVASVDSLEGATGAATGDLEASVDSLETVASTAIDERGYLNGSVDSLETRVSTVEDDLSTLDGNFTGYALATDNSIDSLELVDAALSQEIVDEATARGNADADLAASVDSLEIVDAAQNKSIDSIETAISNILDIPGTDLDQFSEMVTFVKSVDTVNDGLLSDFIGVANGSIDSLEVVDGTLAASIDSLEALNSAGTSALEASVDSLELVDAAQNASIDSLENVDAELSAEIAGNATAIGVNAGDIADLQASVDSLELIDSGLAGDIADANASIDSLEAVDAALSAEFTADTTYVRQGAQPVSLTEARFNTPIRLGATDDIAVFVNGLEIHPVGIAVNTGGEFGGAEASTAEGYTITGTTITFVGLGYDLEGNDHVHVHGIVA